MVRVLAVNNYPSADRFVRLSRSLEAAGAQLAVSGWGECSSALFRRFDGVVLSGSPDMASQGRVTRKYSREVEAVREAEVPVLGVCFGHQLMGSAYGSKVVGNGSPVVRYVETEVLKPDPLFFRLPGRIMVYESHREVIDALPRGFALLASSPTSAIAAMRHSRLPLYGVQFHPERNSSDHPEGATVVRNFVDTLR